MESKGAVLTTRELNRALLDRQMLLHRRDLPAIEVIEHLLGLQAQAPFPPYYGLWSRVEGFRPEELAKLLTDREVVRIGVMRGTVHLISAADCLNLRPLTQPVFDRALSGNPSVPPDVVAMDLPALRASTQELLAEQPRSRAELAPLLGSRWPGFDPKALSSAACHTTPLVQVPPRAVWGSSGQARFATAESWLGRPLDPAPSTEDMVLRYLAAFGPAATADAQKWSGLTRLGEVIDGLRPRLRTFRDERGRELFDLPEAPRPGPDSPAPARLIAEFDNVLLSHTDRTRIISDENRARITTKNAIIPGTVLLDGFVSGTWRIERQRGAAALTITPFRAFSPAERTALTEEGANLLSFDSPGADHHDIRFRAAE